MIVPMVFRSVAFCLSYAVRTHIRISHKFLIRRNLARNATNMVRRCQSTHLMATFGIVVEESVINVQSIHIIQGFSAGTYFYFRRYVLR